MKYCSYVFLSFLLSLSQSNNIMCEISENQKVISNKQGSYNKNSEQNLKYILGIQAGVTRVNIKETGNYYFEADKFFDNYQAIVGVFLQKRIKKSIGLCGLLTYKNLGFKESSSYDYYASNLKISNHYLSSQLEFHFFPDKAKKISLFSGLEFLTLLFSEEKYWCRYSSHKFGEELGFDSMKKIMEPFTLSVIGGVSYEFSNIFPLCFLLQVEYNLLSPTKNRTLKEGDYNPLPYPFKYINFSFKVNIPIYYLK